MMFASSNPASHLSLSVKLTIIFSRTLMGFTIGVSAIRLSWWLHGIFIGFIGSIPMAFPVMDRPGIMIATVVAGIIYGYLIELITTLVFKSKPVGTIKD
jgi:hypothetical protein